MRFAVRDFVKLHELNPPKGAEPVNRTWMFAVAEKDQSRPAFEAVSYGKFSGVRRSDHCFVFDQAAAFCQFRRNHECVHRFFHAVPVFNKNNHRKARFLQKLREGILAPQLSKTHVQSTIAKNKGWL